MSVSTIEHPLDVLLNLLICATGANEASVWKPSEDGEWLIVTNNPKRQASGLTSLRQPLNEGLVSAVYRTGTPMEDVGAFKKSVASKLVDTALEQQTTALSAAPIIDNNGKIVGVISIVQIIDQNTRPVEWGFKVDTGKMMKLAAQLAAHYF